MRPNVVLFQVRNVSDQHVHWCMSRSEFPRHFNFRDDDGYFNYVISLHGLRLATPFDVCMSSVIKYTYLKLFLPRDSIYSWNESEDFHDPMPYYDQISMYYCVQINYDYIRTCKHHSFAYSPSNSAPQRLLSSTWRIFTFPNPYSRATLTSLIGWPANGSWPKRV